MKKTIIAAAFAAASLAGLDAAPTGPYLSYLGDGVGDGGYAAQCNFVGASSGKETRRTVGSGFYGLWAGAYASDVYLSDALGYYAMGGASGCTNVVAIGAAAGRDASGATDCVFIGKNAGRGASGVHGRVDIGGLVYADRESGDFRVGTEGGGLTYSNGVLKVGEDSLFADGVGVWLPNLVETGFVRGVDSNCFVQVKNSTCYLMTNTCWAATSRDGSVSSVTNSGDSGFFMLPNHQNATRFDILVLDHAKIEGNRLFRFFDASTNLLSVVFASGEAGATEIRHNRNGATLYSFLYNARTGLVCWMHREDDPVFSEWAGGSSIRLGGDTPNTSMWYGSAGVGDGAVSIGLDAMAKPHAVSVGERTGAEEGSVAILGWAGAMESVAINGFSYGRGGVAINTFRPGGDYLDSIADDGPNEAADPELVNGQFAVGVMDSPSNFVFDIYTNSIEVSTNVFSAWTCPVTNRTNKAFSHTVTLHEAIREYAAPSFSDAVATNALIAEAGVVYDMTADKDGLAVTLPKRSERAQSFVVRLAPSSETDGTKIAGVAAATDDAAVWKVDWLSGAKQTITKPCYYTFMQTAADRWAVRAEAVDGE